MTKHPQDDTLTLTLIGIDIGKDVFHIVGFDLDGNVVLRRHIKRLALVAEFKKLPPSIVAMEGRSWDTSPSAAASICAPC